MDVVVDTQPQLYLEPRKNKHFIKQLQSSRIDHKSDPNRFVQ